MVTPSFRSVWLLACVAASSSALHLNKSSTPQFHRSSCASAHIATAAQQHPSVCFLICVIIISFHFRLYSGCFLVAKLWEGPRNQDRLVGGWASLWETEECRLLCYFHLSYQRAYGPHLDVRHSSKHAVHRGLLERAQNLSSSLLFF